jgi:hypothetical protein
MIKKIKAVELLKNYDIDTFNMFKFENPYVKELELAL